ncbi:MAG: DUF983 domain-containing protein [Alphaproteobacteria bacterium]|nr:MAG: DUF983 domain-containing protein [Alphaproteobacteria bacterium]
MARKTDFPAVSPYVAGLRGRCPRCGQGPLFDGFLHVAPACSVCKLDYSFADSGDGPAVFIILIAGFILVAGALITEILYQPPYWVHAVVWGPLTVILCLGLMRPFKATLIALQYHNKAQEGRFGEG